MRRITGAILIEMRPDRKIVSAWRGVARAASKPKRAMSSRGPMCDIHSIAQHASPNESGKFALPTAQRPGLLERRRQHRLLDVLLELGPVERAAQHVARAQLARAELLLAARAELLAGHLHSRAPLRQTYT